MNNSGSPSQLSNGSNHAHDPGSPQTPIPTL
ncbi:hypothetical protein A2U01_0102929, partial [Trifolium medium]|nr:hypothetical protein [Trifolium medium]